MVDENGDDQEDNEVMNCCKHLINEMETLKSEIDRVPFNPDTAILARQVTCTNREPSMGMKK